MKKRYLKKKLFVEYVWTHVKKEILWRWSAAAKVHSGLYMKNVRLNGLAQDQTRIVMYVGEKCQIYL